MDSLRGLERRERPTTPTGIRRRIESRNTGLLMLECDTHLPAGSRFRFLPIIAKRDVGRDYCLRRKGAGTQAPADCAGRFWLRLQALSRLRKKRDPVGDEG